MSDCRTCDFNSYRNIGVTDFVVCNHPITLARGPRWQEGDPAMVNWRTADVRIRDIENFEDCPTWTGGVDWHTANLGPLP
jgi:hypothetical protein